MAISPRLTEAQAHALWPAYDSYSMEGRLAVPGADMVKAAVPVIQRLYDAFEGVAGTFTVLGEDGTDGGDKVFKVKFERYAAEDSDVVLDDLMAGKEFQAVLTGQLRDEITEAIKDDGSTVRLLSLADSIDFYDALTGNRK